VVYFGEAGYIWYCSGEAGYIWYCSAHVGILTKVRKRRVVVVVLENLDGDLNFGCGCNSLADLVLVKQAWMLHDWKSMETVVCIRRNVEVCSSRVDCHSC
jgi:hypothetical protein